MDTLKAELVHLNGIKDLKTMLALPGPCLSAYMPLNFGPSTKSDRVNALQWKELIKDLQQKDGNGSLPRELLESVSDWEALLQDMQPEGKAVAVFRSPEVFHVVWIDNKVAAKAVGGPHFCVRPLLPGLTRERTFYLLALSQRDVRLLRCDSRSSEEVVLPKHTPTGFDAYMDTAKPDHLSEKGAVANAASGSKGITTGTTAHKDNRQQFLTHFYQQIDHGVNEALRGKTEPLVLVGVDYELALYRTLNKYPHLAEESVEGAPNSLKSGEMHARALDAIQRCYETKVDEALAEYNHKVGGGASNRLKEIVPAAHDGRVLTLLVSGSLESTGAFDASTNTVKGRETGTPDDEDLVNDAVVQTILHAGRIFVAPNAKMPHGAPMAAIYRF